MLPGPHQDLLQVPQDAPAPVLQEHDQARGVLAQLCVVLFGQMEQIGPYRGDVLAGRRQQHRQLAGR